MVNSDRPNILIITFDCLRPDHFSGIGYKGTHTPTFDRIISEGVNFTNAYCQAPNTWISHASFFTGCNPYQHGLRTPIRKISDKVVTIAEVFHKAGYFTFGLPAMSLLSKEAGFSRGFDEYCLARLKSSEGILSHRYYRTIYDTLAITEDWLKCDKYPFFIWIHYFGLHKVEESLLDLPIEYRSHYSKYAQYYDGKISFADEQFLAPLISKLEELGVLDKTVLVLWSDHGEDLNKIEYGTPYWGHNWDLSEDVMRILLTIRAPWVLPAGIERDDIVRSIDLFQTLLDIAGIEVSLEQFEGRSLLTPSVQSDTVVYMENLCQGFVGVRKGKFKLIISESDVSSEDTKRVFPSFNNKLTSCIRLAKGIAQRLLPKRWRRTSPLEPWWRAKGEPEEILDRLLSDGIYQLYDLSVDPEEKFNLADQNPDLVSELKQILYKLTAQTVTFQKNYLTAEEEAEITKHLEDLGYL